MIFFTKKNINFFVKCYARYYFFFLSIKTDGNGLPFLIFSLLEIQQESQQTSISSSPPKLNFQTEHSKLSGEKMEAPFSKTC